MKTHDPLPAPTLDMPDPALLIDALRQQLARRGEVRLSVGNRRLVALDEHLFVVDVASGLLSGPFLEYDDALARTGRLAFRVAWSDTDPGPVRTPPEGADRRSVYAWGGAYVVVDTRRAEARSYGELRDAVLEGEPRLEAAPGYTWITSGAMEADEVRALLPPAAECSVSRGVWVEIDGERYGPSLWPGERPPLAPRPAHDGP